MEITPTDGEDVVLEETLETDSDNNDSVVDAGEEELEQAEETQEETEEEKNEQDGENVEESQETPQEGQETPSLDEIYSLENPMPVVIVEPEEEEYELEVFALSGSYPGVIADSYLNYFRGIVQKLDWEQHYVVYRSGQYSYTMVYGKDVDFNGSRFVGTGNVVNLYRSSSSTNYEWYVSYSTDSLSLSPSSLYVYSDLGMYPDLKEGGTHVEFMVLLFAVAFAIVYCVCHDIFDYIMEHVYRK